MTVTAHAPTGDPFFCYEHKTYYSHCELFHGCGWAPCSMQYAPRPHPHETTSAFFATCSCPPFWNAVVPPPCAVHNPPMPYSVWTTTTANTVAFPPVNTAIRGKRRKPVRRRRR